MDAKKAVWRVEMTAELSVDETVVKKVVKKVAD